MIETTQRKLTFALLALLLILAGCKGESPTAPPPIGTGPTPGGGVTPPTNATIALAVSNPNPVVNSTSLITATVTVDNQPVPNGTAVQWSIQGVGTFVENGGQSILKTTTGGVSTVTVTSASAGTATITATVNNVSRSTTVTFSAVPVTPPTPSTAPTITAVTPAIGRPQGGEQITISGTNFRSPVRVLFDAGNGQPPKEGFVVSVTPTQIVVLTPAFDVGTGQTVPTDVIVLVEAGTPTEVRVVKAQGFTFQSAVLTPSLVSVNPATGPSTGGTRITITGSGFQAPVQVTMGGSPASTGGPLNLQVELQVISVNFGQIIAITPEFRLIDPGLTLNDGSVFLRVLNINSAKDAVLGGAFRFLPRMAITTAGPTSGPFSGGTRVSIDGIGFDDPVAVSIAGVAAQVIRVSGSQVIAITSPAIVTGCADISGPILVTNTNNGDSATGPIFTYRVPKPVVISVTNPNTLGGTTTIVVLNAFSGVLSRFTIENIQASITAAVANPDNTTTFTVQIPTTLRLETVSCPAGGTAPQPTSFDVTFTDLITGCTATAPDGLTVTPPAAPVLFLNPGAFQPFTARITPASAGPPPTPASVAPSPSQTISIINTGSTTLTITGITTAGAGCPRFSVAAPPIPPNIDLNQCESLPVIVQYNGQTTATTETCTLTITTNAGTRNLLLVGTSQ